MKSLVRVFLRLFFWFLSYGNKVRRKGFEKRVPTPENRRDRNEQRIARLKVLRRNEARLAQAAGRNVRILMKKGHPALAKCWALRGVNHWSATRTYNDSIQNLRDAA